MSSLYGYQDLHTNSPTQSSLKFTHLQESHREVRSIERGFRQRFMATGGMKKKLGIQGLEVSAQGINCRLGGEYSGARDQKPAAIILIHHAILSGVTFIDMCDFYTPEDNEVLLSKALKFGVREKVVLATEIGISHAGKRREVRGDPVSVRADCEASLKRLEVSCIDLCYHHGTDTRVPIEITMRELKKLVEEGKIKYIGLSEVSASTIRRANDVHPITAVRVEWSLWSRDVEEDIIPTCRELGIGIVAEGHLVFRLIHDENLDLKAFNEKVRAIAEKKGCTREQLALAWLHHQGNDVCPIPITFKIENFKHDIGALSVKLTPEEMIELEISPQYRYIISTFKNSETPPLSSWKTD